MRYALMALMVVSLLAGCARATSISASASERNNAGYGLHLGLGGYVSR